MPAPSHLVDTHERELADAFWTTHLRLGFIVMAAESVAVATYLLMTPSGSHRLLLMAISVVSLVACLVSLGLVAGIALQPWRDWFSFGWTLVGGALVLITAEFDGGLHTPLLALLTLPVVYAASAFSPVQVLVCGAATLAELVSLGIGDSNGVSVGGDELMVSAAVIGLTFVAVAASRNRAMVQAHERELSAQLSELAMTDGLTGCLNHRAFSARLHEEIDRALRYDQPLTIVASDVDDFKTINDQCGHGAGDDVLAALGTVLREGLRSSDFVGRVGGDEFVVVLPNTGLSGGVARAKRTEGFIAAAGLPLKLSMGVASLDRHAPNSRALLEQADRCVYHIKDTGRSGVATMHDGTPQRRGVLATT